ncbi:MAG TPA: outer membrane protein assembly factor BamD [Alphaproteobacteria bacterium]|nr:outer membrane protein assembly factor BamD [Alphaproteobacteria bacterium]HNS43694.1 outer membrane protein assembly factor BamD [Alphaproteobacteria bacterium]
MQKFIARLLVTSVLSVGILSGCSSEEKQDPLTVDRPADQIFKEADAAEKEGNYKKASVLYSEVERQHPYSDYATLSQLRQAEAAYSALKYDDAVIALERFVELHPGHDQVPYAYYMMAMCYYEQMTDVARDQGMTKFALEALDTVINRFPDSKYARDAELKRDLVLDHLAGKEMEVGRYYVKKNEYNAAINRFLMVVKEYQTTTHVPEALHRLVESYMVLGLKDEATHVAAVLGHNFPGSQWYEDSYALLDPAQRRKLDDKRSWVSRTMDSLLTPD